MNRKVSPQLIRGVICSALILLSLTLCLVQVHCWERALSTAPQPDLPPGHWLLRDYAAGTPRNAKAPFSREERGSALTTTYNFVAPGNQPLHFTLSTPTADYRAYRNRFGYRQEELDALYREQRQQLEQAYHDAVKSGQPQAELDTVYATIKANFHARTNRLIFERGFRFINDSTMTADIPRIVRDNVTSLRPAALAILAAAREHGSTADDIIALALPFAQTALTYEALPPQSQGRLTAGFSPPLEVLLEGRGDCDSKTALLAALLLNWDQMKLIGIGIPGHYLLGVLRSPGRGDAFYTYNGLTYVLMEPAGPAWLPPGTVAESTLLRLGAGDQIIIEPLSAI
jgi:hypothetical protein